MLVFKAQHSSTPDTSMCYMVFWQRICQLVSCDRRHSRQSTLHARSSRLMSWRSFLCWRRSETLEQSATTSATAWPSSNDGYLCICFWIVAAWMSDCSFFPDINIYLHFAAGLNYQLSIQQLIKLIRTSENWIALPEVHYYNILLGFNECVSLRLCSAEYGGIGLPRPISLDSIDAWLKLLMQTVGLIRPTVCMSSLSELWKLSVLSTSASVIP